MPTRTITRPTLYGSSISGNCLKGKWLADLVGLEYDWVEIDILAGESRTPDFLVLNANGQVPVLRLPSDDEGPNGNAQALDQSNAILIYLAEQAGSALLPSDAVMLAQMMSWLFWEQYNHEASIAVRRYRKAYLGLPDEALDPQLLPKGHAALQRMEETLDGQDWICGAEMTLADIALVAYTRVAHEGGFELSSYPHLLAWISRTETALNIPHARAELDAATGRSE